MGKLGLDMKVRRFSIYFIIIFILIGILNIAIAQEKAVDAFYKDGLKKYILGNYEAAITDFESALKLEPGNIKVQNMYFTTLVKLGNIEYSKGDLQKAKLYYEKALEVSGGNKDIKNKLVEINNLLEEKKIKKKAEAIGKVPSIHEKAGKEIAGKVEAPEQQTKVTRTSKKAPPPKKAISLAGKSVNASPVVQNVKLPFDIEKFIAQQNEENRKMLDSIVKAQREERQAFLNENRKMIDRVVEAQGKERKNLIEHIKTLTKLQQEERKFFSNSLLLIVGGGILIILIIITVIFFFLRRLAKSTNTRMMPEYSLGLISENYIKEIPELIDESRLITDERYSDIVKAKKLKDLYLEFKDGDPSWDSIQEYITEVSSDIKNDILNAVERKLKESEGKNSEQVYKLLLPLITDGDIEIRSRSRKIISEITDRNVAGYLESPNIQSENNPLSIPALMGMAKVADMKTKRPEHSIIVAELSQSIAELLNGKDINPKEVYKVGLAHDIGYMELPASIFRKSRNLTEEEFEIIKTHPVKGVNLLSNAVQLPQIFMDGIKYHHERMDGSGYPEALEGNAIPLIARIIAVADFFTAVTSNRLYRNAMSIDKAVKLLKSLSGKIFDKDIVEILINIVNEEMEKINE